MSGGIKMHRKEGYKFEIQYTKVADKFLMAHEDVRDQYEAAIKELLVGDHPEKVDVKRIKGKKNNYYRIKLGGYRVVYAIINGKIVVIKTVLAGTRGDVYTEVVPCTFTNYRKKPLGYTAFLLFCAYITRMLVFGFSGICRIQ